MTEVLLLFGIEVCLEVNAEKTEYCISLCSMKRIQKKSAHKIANESFLNGVYLRYRHPPLYCSLPGSSISLYWSRVSLSFFYAFAKLRKATVCLSFRIDHLGSHWMDFHEIWLWLFFENLPKNIQVWLKSDKNNGHFTWRPLQICDNIYLNSPLNEKYFRQVAENIKLYIFVQ
jgi:hypothetical protein